MVKHISYKTNYILTTTMTTRPSFPSLLNPWWEEAASLMSSLLLSKGNWEISSGGTFNPYLLEMKFQGWKGGIAH